MFRAIIARRFYVCIVRETKGDPLLTAVEVKPSQIVDIIYEKGDDSEFAWRKLRQIAKGENIALGTHDIRRFRNLDFDADQRSVIGALMPQLHGTSVIEHEFALSVCNEKRLRQLRKGVGEPHAQHHKCVGRHHQLPQEGEDRQLRQAVSARRKENLRGRGQLLMLDQLVKRYEFAFGSKPSQEAITEMEYHVDRRGEHFVAYCIAEARRRKARSFGFLRSILRNQDAELIQPETVMPHSVPDLLDDDDYIAKTADEFLECLDTYATCIGERMTDDDLEFFVEVFNKRGDHYVNFLIFEATSRGVRKMSYLRSIHKRIGSSLLLVDADAVDAAFKAFPSLASEAHRGDPGKKIEDVVPFDVIVTDAEDESGESSARESES